METVVICSNAKSPLRVWPSRLICRPNPSTRTYGPAGSSTSTVVPARVKLLLTAWAVLLMRRLKLPTKVTPGTLIPIVPDNWPAKPAEVRSNAPSPFVTETKLVVPSPRLRLTLLAITVVNFSPPAAVTCSKEKLPVRVWPSTESVTPSPVTRTNGPAVSCNVKV